ncbi:MAG: 2Fe-2S iron-sulfur cluster binding domain-containing protein [Methyloprofundus sp.]|nr:2Fe-2S iron-sulfur cluster binding domain-containing protein [Methyloprofundus sp.]
MTELIIDNKSYTCAANETVLDALLREEVEVSYSCKKGTCQSCMMRSTGNAPPEVAQKGLKDTQKKQSYFLACLCMPEQDMEIRLPEQSELYSQGKVVENSMLNRNTLLLKLQCQDIQEYFAGQFVNLQRADGLTRSYSIANTPQESGILEFHIRELADGQFSSWLHNDIKVGDAIAVSEPQGHCFYIPERADEDLVLVGTGTGLAPLVGILHDALEKGHTGPISLFHGASVLEDLYRVKEMRELAEKHANFSYFPCISGDIVPEGFISGRADVVAKENHSEWKKVRLFLCGHPEMVSSMKMDGFLSGVSMDDIYTDAFEHSA